jgi:hypothetical protein
MLLLFAAMPVLAEQKIDFVPLDGVPPIPRVNLKFVSPEQCEQTIQQIFPPEAKIQEGLNAIAGNNVNTEMRSCLEPVLDKWKISYQERENKPYDLRRLLTLYSAYLKSGKNDVHEFCRDYQKGIERIVQLRKLGLTSEPFLTEKQWKQAEKYGFTEADLIVISVYTREDFRLINPMLRKGEALEPVYQAVKEGIDSLLDKLPNYTDGPVNRVAYLMKDVGDKYQKDEVVCDNAYMSTSRRKKWNWTPEMIFMGQSKYQFTIHLKQSGRLIREFANRPQEEEVLVIVLEEVN